ncbi:MAG: glycosyl hydrolase, partial [Novosphingobium sp.]
PGLSLGGIGQYFNRHETWAEMARPWIDYLARNALLLQQGRNVADVAYFYGEEAPLTGLYGERPVPDAPKHYGYDFVNTEALVGALANDGAELVTPGGARYQALYLCGSSGQMTLPTLRRIAALVEGGATVIGLRPEANPSLAGDPGEWAALRNRLWRGSDMTEVGRGRVIAVGDLDTGLAAMALPPDFRFTGGAPDTDIPFLHRKLGDGDSYFLANRRDRRETIEARFRVTGKAPELWRADSGAIEPVSYRIENGATVVPLTLAADESVHVVFRRPAPAGGLNYARAEPVDQSTLAGPWTVTFQPGRGAPVKPVKVARLAPLDANSSPGIRYFSGIATYANKFDAPKGWRSGRPLWLDLGEVREVAEVVVNGKRAGTVWHAPYRLDISRLVKARGNRVEVRVANLWVNRLIGDAQPGATPVAWTGLQAYKPDSPLRRSGLIGPVRLLGERR